MLFIYLVSVFGDFVGFYLTSGMSLWPANRFEHQSWQAAKVNLE
jgi:hypothetical protein